MEFNKLIKKRRAVRRYLPDKEIQEKDIGRILEAVSQAPSARNLQCYRVFALKSNKAIKDFSKAAYGQKDDFISNAVLILVFFTDPIGAIESFGQKGEFYALQDATIAATYAVLSAVDSGYQTCWVGNFEEKKVKKICSTKLKPVASIVIGYGDEEPETKSRKPLKEISKTI